MKECEALGARVRHETAQWGGWGGGGGAGCGGGLRTLRRDISSDSSTTLFSDSSMLSCTQVHVFFLKYYCACVLILPYVPSYYHMYPHTTIYVSSYYYVCVLILLCMCPMSFVPPWSYNTRIQKTWNSTNFLCPK